MIFTSKSYGLKFIIFCSMIGQIAKERDNSPLQELKAIIIFFTQIYFCIPEIFKPFFD